MNPLDTPITSAILPDMAPLPFAQRLRAARETRGLTQREAASAIGVHVVTLARWEIEANEPRGLARKAAEAWIARTKGKKGGRHG